MKTLNTLFFIISILAATLLLNPSHVYADSCAPTEIPLTTAQHILLASNVFVGTVKSIKNDTDHQWNVHFSIEKLWKGTAGQSLTVTTNELQGCRYSITTGVKYLVYTSGFPPWLQMSWTRPYADSQNDIAMLNDPNFQAQEKTKEELNKKLEAAKDSISNMMGSKMSPLPINMVSVDVLNSTLDVGIDSAKAKLSDEKYQEKIRELVGNIPIKISFGQYFALPARVTDNSTRSDSLSIMSPLKQFKSGVASKDVQCKESLQLVIKVKDGSPACVKPDDAYILIYRGWAKEFIQSVSWISQSMCDGTEVPSGDARRNIFPVLVMSPNSTATVCVTYNIKSDWQSYQNKDVYPHGILETCCFVHMGWYSSHTSSNKFDILSNPLLFNVTGVYNGSKISVTYKIYAKSDSKGFYDTSVPFDECLSYPLAVGYSTSEVDATKFHADFDIPCFNSIEDVDSVKLVSGMTYREVQFP